MTIWDVLLSYGTVVVLIGAGLLGASAGMVGCFAVLRRRSLTGDALAHAALPGICLGFLVFEERVLPLMLLGALITGLLGTQVISLLRRYTRIKEDAAIGIVLSVFFGLGIVLMTYVQQTTTTGNKAGLETYVLGQAAGMVTKDVYFIAVGSLVCLAIVLLLYKEFKLITFDAAFARAQGWPVLRLDLLLMGLIAVTVVVGLPTVGAVMIAALIIIPAAAARFWTDHLANMLVLSALIGLAMGVVGTAFSAVTEKLPTGPIIVLIGSVLFLLSVLFSPRRGVLARVLARFRFQHELKQRNLMSILYDLSEPERRRFSLAEIQEHASWAEPELSRLLNAAVQQSHLKRDRDQFYLLTDDGLRRATEVARAQRLWELFAQEHAELTNGLVNWASDRPQDVIPEDVIEELATKLQQQGRWPQNGMEGTP